MAHREYTIDIKTSYCENVTDKEYHVHVISLSFLGDRWIYTGVKRGEKTHDFHRKHKSDFSYLIVEIWAEGCNKLQLIYIIVL